MDRFIKTTKGGYVDRKSIIRVFIYTHRRCMDYVLRIQVVGQKRCSYTISKKYHEEKEAEDALDIFMACWPTNPIR